MNVINPFLGPSAGLQFYLSAKPQIIISRAFLVQEINQSAEMLFEVNKSQVLGKNFLEVCKDRNLMAELEQNLNFMFFGNVYQPKEHLLIKNREGTFSVKLSCHPMRKNAATTGSYDLIAIACTSTPLLNKNINELHKDNFTKKDTNRFQVSNYADINVTADDMILFAPGSFWLINRDHIVLKCSLEACRVCGMSSPQEAIGKTILDFAKNLDWPMNTAQDIYNEDEEVMLAGVPKFCTQTIMPQGKSASPVSQIGAKKPVFDLSGKKVVGLIGIGVWDGGFGERFRLKT